MVSGEQSGKTMHVAWNERVIEQVKQISWKDQGWFVRPDRSAAECRSSDNPENFVLIIGADRCEMLQSRVKY